jgi:hypothetical protein
MPTEAQPIRLPLVPTVSGSAAKTKWCEAAVGARPHLPQRGARGHGAIVRACATSRQSVDKSGWAVGLAQFVLGAAARAYDTMHELQLQIQGAEAAFRAVKGKAPSRGRPQKTSPCAAALGPTGTTVGELVWNNDHLQSVLCVAFESVPRAVAAAPVLRLKRIFVHVWKAILPALHDAFFRLDGFLKQLLPTAPAKCAWSDVWPPVRRAMHMTFMAIRDLAAQLQAPSRTRGRKRSAVAAVRTLIYDVVDADRRRRRLNERPKAVVRHVRGLIAAIDKGFSSRTRRRVRAAGA